MKIWVIYNEKKKKYLSSNWKQGASLISKINNHTSFFMTFEHAQQVYNNMLTCCKERIASTETTLISSVAIAKGDLYIESKKKELDQLIQNLPIIEEAKIIETPIPILFDKRKQRGVQWKTVDILEEYCACCGVRIPQTRAVQFHKFYICIMCLNGMARSVLAEVEDFEKEYPDLVDIYKTEKFIRAL